MLIMHWLNKISDVLAIEMLLLIVIFDNIVTKSIL